MSEDIRGKFDSKLRKVDSIFNKTNKFIGGLQFDAGYEVPQGGISYTHILPSARTYAAIVAPGGTRGIFSNIQEAINYVNNEGGGRILIKKGTYTLSDDITLYSDIHLIGEDNDSCLLDFNSTSKQLKIVGTASADKRNVVVHNLGFKNRTSDTGGAIYMDYVEDITITNNYFTNNTGSNAYDIELGVSNHANDRVLIERNSSISSNSFLYVNQGTKVEILFNYVKTATKYGIYLVGMVGAIMGNHFDDITDDVIKVEDVITNGQIIGNYALNCEADGFDIGSSEETIITNNVLDGIKSGTFYGIKLTTAPDNIISNNYIRTFGASGIWLSASDRNIMHGNACYDNSAYGIDISNSTCDENIVVGNMFLGNDTDGLNDGGTSTTAANNVTT